MTQAKIRENILSIVRGEMAYADPISTWKYISISRRSFRRHHFKFDIIAK
jgi:hypothetical protein